MNYKIALCGAGGTGKGTLMKTFFEMYKPENILPIPSPVKPISNLLDPYAMDFKDFTRENKVLMQYCTLASEMNAERIIDNSGFGFVAERSVIDFLPYFAKLGFKGERMRAYAGFVARYLRKNPYDLIVRLHIEFEPNDKKKSSWKERDPEDRKDTEQYLNQWFKDHKIGIPVINVTGTSEERAVQVIKAIQKLEKEKKVA